MTTQALKRESTRSPREGEGRPSSYQPEFAAAAKTLCQLGATVADMAEAFGVVPSTVSDWLKKVPEFSEAVLFGRSLADSHAQRSLFKKATGYNYEEQRAFIDKAGGEHVITLTQYAHPDNGAIIYWLKNRDPKNWRDRIEVNHLGTEQITELTNRLGGMFKAALKGLAHSSNAQSSVQRVIEAEFSEVPKIAAATQPEKVGDKD